MDEPTTRDTGLDLPQPAIGAATMPLLEQPPGGSVRADSGNVSVVANMPQTPGYQPLAAQSTGFALSQAPPAISPTTAPLAAVTQPEAGQGLTSPVHSQVEPAATSIPDEAADAEIIEKEWVAMAKTVISEAQGDPYKQVIELNKLRANYMKKRYDKDIKLPDA